VEEQDGDREVVLDDDSAIGDPDAVGVGTKAARLREGAASLHADPECHRFRRQKRHRRRQGERNQSNAYRFHGPPPVEPSKSFDVQDTVRPEVGNESAEREDAAPGNRNPLGYSPAESVPWKSEAGALNCRTGVS